MKLRLQELLQLCIDLKPRAIWLSFGDVKPLAKSIKAAGIKVVVQVQYLDDVEAALEAGADVIVGQVTIAQVAACWSLLLSSRVKKAVPCAHEVALHRLLCLMQSTAHARNKVVQVVCCNVLETCHACMEA